MLFIHLAGLVTVLSVSQGALNFEERLEKSTTLVVGTSYRENENKNFEKIDPNYIALGNSSTNTSDITDNPIKAPENYPNQIMDRMAGKWNTAAGDMHMLMIS